MTNIWEKLPKPFLVLAPMEDVTDVVFREVVSTLIPKPDLLFTEFVSTDGLCSKGFDKTVTKFNLSENQKPVIAQIWGTKPENYFKSAQIISKLGYSGIDINMGCPIPKITKNGACSALINNQPLAAEIIKATKEGSNDLPVSVKTRIGFKNVDTENWISFLLKQNLSALTVHGRTAKQLSDGDANWEEIGKAVTLRDQINPQTIVIGNGDVKSYMEATTKHEKYKVDGVMIGRGIFHNPWVFEKTDIPSSHEVNERLTILLKHTQLFEETWGKAKNFEIMKKFVKMYLKDFDGANEMRLLLMQCKSLESFKEVINKLIVVI